MEIFKDIEIFHILENFWDVEGLELKHIEIHVEIQDMDIFQDMENFQDMEIILDIDIIQDMEVKHHTLYSTTIAIRK